MRASAYHLKPSEIRKLIIAIGSFRDRCIIKALFWLGLRRKELCGLDLRDIDFERKRVKVRGKGDKTRIIPMWLMNRETAIERPVWSDRFPM